MDIIKKFLSEYNEIEQYYEFLVQKTKRHEFVGIVNEWLIDNFYILVEHKNSIIKEKKNLRKNNKLYLKLYPEINNIVVLNNFNINFKILCNELKKYTTMLLLILIGIDILVVNIQSLRISRLLKLEMSLTH